MGSPPDLLAMAAQHGSQDASHLEIKSQLISRLVHGDLGEHAGIPSMEQVASVADQAAKMNMRKLGSRCVVVVGSIAAMHTASLPPTPPQ
eukprot:scaffold7488_cov37-Tisochrysis_lutea.AAC.2